MDLDRPETEAGATGVPCVVVAITLTRDLVSTKVDDMSEVVVGIQSSERMTWAQIRAAYHGQWVLMVDVDWVNDIDIDLRSAVVVAHGKHRRDTLPHVKKLPRPVDFTHLFIGDPGHEE